MSGQFFFEIAVNIPGVEGVFHYHLPPELEGRIAPGHLVTVPFGKQTAQGIVLRQVGQPAVIETKAVIDLLDPSPVVTPAQLLLAQHLSEYYLAPLAACIDLMIPAGLSQHADILYTAHDDSVTRSDGSLHPTQARLLSLLKKRGPLRGQQIDHAMARLNWREAARALTRQGRISTQSILPPPTVRPKTLRTAQLACPPSYAHEQLPNLGRKGTPALLRRQAIIRFLLTQPGPADVTWVYAESGGNLQDLYMLADLNLIALGETEVWRDPLENLPPQTYDAPTLTGDQSNAWDVVHSQFRRAQAGQPVKPVLLFGVTGSGKTEIYLKAVEHALEQKQQVIVLVPEIALTPQTVRRFAGRFPGQVGLLHSALSPGERYDTWRRARQGDLSVVVGPRSALFTPFSNLGLIVVDECHDDTYYQADHAPHYHARQAAIDYARLAGAVCLLGSATPDVTTTYLAEQGLMQPVHLPSRILAHKKTVRAQLEREGLEQPHDLIGDEPVIYTELPPVMVIDMRLELTAGNRSIFSRELHSALESTLAQNRQAILFLNRRGAATYVFCRDCGATLRCPRCDIPLTYHLESQQSQPGLLCHHCNYRRELPKSCPACGSHQIRHYGLGTEQVEAQVQELFPQARTLRWDYETTRKQGAHEIILSHFAAHRADILIGTQMIAKGLDLPLVTLVGAILADVGMNLPDYRASERAFQVLTQVSGRAGRSPLGGQVILQTFQPEHYVIQAAAHHDYASFYQQELAHRRHLGYPPFNQLVRLLYRHTDDLNAQRAASKLATDLKEWIADSGRKATDLIGPAPCFFRKLAGQYRWQIILRGPDPSRLLIDRSIRDWDIEVNPPNLL